MASGIREAASTGIAGLDYILCGGIPRDRVYLLQGDPGVGKTTLGLQFLLEGVAAGETCLYITLSESVEELNAVARSHGWDLSGIHLYEELVGGDANPDEDETTVFYPSEIELGETVRKIVHQVEKVKPSRVVIDSLSELRLLAQTTLRYRKQILALKQFFAGCSATVLFLDDRTAEHQDMQLQSVPHGVIELERFTPPYGAARRRLQIVKMRGLNFRDGYHDFSIRTGGIVVYPRLIASDHPVINAHQQLPSGMSMLDTMLGGGVDRGTSTLIMGPAGSGKSALSIQYVVAAAARGEHCRVFLFEESISTMIARSRALGFPVEKYIDSGHIVVRQIDPAELLPGQFAELVRHSVESEGASVLVIDSLNGYLNAVPEERFLLLHLHELLTYLGRHGVATLLIFAQHGLLGQAMSSSVDVSYLADCVILLRYFEAMGRINKAISVVKKRSSKHETSIREFAMGPDGIKVGNELSRFRGVLSGIPSFEGTILSD